MRHQIAHRQPVQEGNIAWLQVQLVAIDLTAVALGVARGRSWQLIEIDRNR